MSTKFVCMILIAFLQFVCKLFQHLLACSTNTSDLKSLCNRRSQHCNFWFCPKMERKKKEERRNLFPQTSESENHVKTNSVFHMVIGTRCPYAPPVGLILGPLHTSRNAHKQAAQPGEGVGGRRHVLLSVPCPWERIRTTTTTPGGRMSK